MASRNLPGMRSPSTGKAFARKTSSGPRWTGAVELIPSLLGLPLRWRAPRRVFVNSMSDLFHESLSDGAIAQVLAVMLLAPRHTFQVLTKRPARMQQFLSRRGLYDDVLWRANALRAARPELNGVGIGDPSMHPARWIWWGVSVENQATADERIPLLLETQAAVRFVSYEPALGPVDFHAPLHTVWLGDGRATSLDWVIVGGESGPGARPCEVAWIRSVVRQCREAGVACFCKQMGANVRTRNDSLSTERDPDVPTDWPEPEYGWNFGRNVEENLDGYRDDYQGAPVRIRLKHPKGGDPAEWPEDLRVREFPGRS
jgi:protein gp37